MTRTIEQVAEFADAFNCYQRADEGLAPDTVSVLRYQLIAEEGAKELSHAFCCADLVAMLDACCDLQYVVDGCYLAYGLRRSARPVCGPTRLEVGEPRVPNPDIQMIILAWISEGLFWLMSGQLNRDLFEVRRGLDKLVEANEMTLFRARLLRLFPEAFAEVHRSNMTKLVDGRPVLNPAGRVVKPDHYEPPRLRELLLGRYPGLELS